MNVYGYVNNDPINFIDSTGLCAVSFLDSLQNMLDLAGLAPVVGNAADLVNVLISLGRGDMVGAALRGMQAIPGIGQGVAAARLTKGVCCFVAGTKVLAKDGYKNIEDIQLGELVYSKDVETGEQGWKPVTQLFQKYRLIYELVVIAENGEEKLIKTTDDHPFYVVSQGWVNTIDLQPGYAIETGEDGWVTVKSVLTRDVYDVTYNLEVADYHTYYATELDLLVHNCNIAKRVDTPHTINTGGKAPKTSDPNSIIESRRADGSSSATYYDDKGRAFSREDYGQQSTHGSLGRRADGRSVAHEHRFDYNDRGYPVKQNVYRPLSENGAPAGPWKGE
jgi:hypothetical protein